MHLDLVVAPEILKLILFLSDSSLFTSAFYGLNDLTLSLFATS